MPNIPGTITLSLDSIAVTIGAHPSPFTLGGYSRQGIEDAEVGRTIVGTPKQGAPAYENPYIWQISCICKKEIALNLQGMQRRADTKRRNRQEFAITCQDLVQDFVEDARTRAIAADTTEAETAFNQKYYYAVFRVWISGLTAFPVKDLSGNWRVSFTMTELSKVGVG